MIVTLTQKLCDDFQQAYQGSIFTEFKPTDEYKVINFTVPMPVIAIGGVNLQIPPMTNWLTLQSIKPIHYEAHNQPLVTHVEYSDVIVRDPEIHDAATYDDPEIGSIWALQDATYATLKKKKKKKRSRKKKKPEKKKKPKKKKSKKTK